ncbi:hypothetical protein G3A43_07880 [Paraburkholderia aspalathi]|nr:hypothetical protein [Paraburkholderia aspalathi]MBK3780175.1 hypothetical protein [Paraburkholderia aspalathi]
MNETLREMVVARLVERGWTGLREPALGIIHYRTAVGDKQALAYMADFGPAETNVMLRGDYQSEGRNVLESYSVLIPKTADEAKVNELVDLFDINAEKAVNESYARRLWLRFDPSAPR